jgi:virginiamycin B lyase
MKMLASLLTWRKGSRTYRRRVPPTSLRRRPVLESLEGRWLPSTLIEGPTLPTANAAPTGITSAPDGSVWFTERSANQLGRIGTNGVLTEYAIPTAASAPEQITASPDGSVWFTERYGRKIGRISEAGGPISEYVVPGYGAYPTAITTTPAGKVWFATADASATARLDCISATGTITQLPTGATRTTVTSLTGGPDGNLWVTQVSSYWGDSVARVTTTGWGSFTNYRLPNHVAGPQSITVGPDNNLWFTEAGDSQIGRITLGGTLTEFALATGSRPQQIVSGADGALWFTEVGTNKIGRLSTGGQLTETALATPSSQPFGITRRSDGSLWFTEQGGDKIGEIVM